jgi:hypothetical protein
MSQEQEDHPWNRPSSSASRASLQEHGIAIVPHFSRIRVAPYSGRSRLRSATGPNQGLALCLADRRRRVINA